MKKAVIWMVSLVVIIVISILFPEQFIAFTSSDGYEIFDLMVFILFPIPIIYVVIKYKRTPKEDLSNPTLYKVLLILGITWLILGVAITILNN